MSALKPRVRSEVCDDVLVALIIGRGKKFATLRLEQSRRDARVDHVGAEQEPAEVSGSKLPLRLGFRRVPHVHDEASQAERDDEQWREKREHGFVEFVRVVDDEATRRSYTLGDCIRMSRSSDAEEQLTGARMLSRLSRNARSEAERPRTLRQPPRPEYDKAIKGTQIPLI